MINTNSRAITTAGPITANGSRFSLARSDLITCCSPSLFGSAWKSGAAREARSAKPHHPISDRSATHPHLSTPVCAACRRVPSPSVGYVVGQTIDPLSAEPVYRQVARIVTARIESGELQPDRPIPSEHQLQQEFGIARDTARRAIAYMREAGLIVTVPGRGSFVKPVE